MKRSGPTIEPLVVAICVRCYTGTTDPTCIGRGCEKCGGLVRELEQPWSAKDFRAKAKHKLVLAGPLRRAKAS